MKGVMMVDLDILKKLGRAFPHTILNAHGEVVVHKSGQYFQLGNCETEMDVRCKVIEFFSRAAFKTEPYYSAAANRKFQKYMLDGINKYLGTDFTEEDMEVIYTYLGNAIKHNKTIEFIESGYNMDFFEQFKGG